MTSFNPLLEALKRLRAEATPSPWVMWAGRGWPRQWHDLRKDYPADEDVVWPMAPEGRNTDQEPLGVFLRFEDQKYVVALVNAAPQLIECYERTEAAELKFVASKESVLRADQLAAEVVLLLKGGDDLIPGERCTECGLGGVGLLRDALSDYKRSRAALVLNEGALASRIQLQAENLKLRRMLQRLIDDADAFYMCSDDTDPVLEVGLKASLRDAAAMLNITLKSDDQTATIIIRGDDFSVETTVDEDAD